TAYLCGGRLPQTEEEPQEEETSRTCLTGAMARGLSGLTGQALCQGQTRGNCHRTSSPLSRSSATHRTARPDAHRCRRHRLSSSNGAISFQVFWNLEIR